MTDSSAQFLAGALAEALAASSVSVNCNHGSWSTVTQTCVCDTGWTTDWTNQDILSSNYVFCNSQASTQSPTGSATSRTSFSKNMLIVIGIICVVVVVGACAVIAFYCSRRLRRSSAERASARDAVRAAEAHEKQWRAESVLVARQQQQQQLHQQRAWTPGVEEMERCHRAAIMDWYMSLSSPSQQQQRSCPYSSSRYPTASRGDLYPQQHAGPLTHKYDAVVYPELAAFADETEPWPAQEPIGPAYSHYHPRAPTPTTESYATYSEMHPSRFTAPDPPADEYGLVYSPRRSVHQGYGRPPY